MRKRGCVAQRNWCSYGLFPNYRNPCPPCANNEPSRCCSKRTFKSMVPSSVERGPRRIAKDFVAIKILRRLPPRHSEIIVVAHTA